MATFVGEFETTVDPEKHRLAISAALRERINTEEDGANFILTLGPDRHLRLYPDRYYERLLNSLRRSPLPDRNSSKIGLMFAMARVVKPDAQGRIVLPEKCMGRALLAEKVTMVGWNDHIQVWPSQEWDDHVQAELPHYGELLYEASERMMAQEPKT